MDDGTINYLVSIQNTVFSFILLLLGIFVVLSTFLPALPLVQQKIHLKESIGAAITQREKEDLLSRMGSYEKMFIVLRTIGVGMIALSFFGLMKL